MLTQKFKDTDMSLFLRMVYSFVCVCSKVAVRAAAVKDSRVSMFETDKTHEDRNHEHRILF
jgi:hypothetical protein